MTDVRSRRFVSRDVYDALDEPRTRVHSGIYPAGRGTQVPPRWLDYMLTSVRRGLIESRMTIRSQPFGSTGRSVTPIGLGGEGILRTHGESIRAADVIAK